MSATGLGLALAGNNFQLDSDINTALANITAAVTSLANLSGTYSAASTIIDTRTDFTNSMIALLDNGADGLTSVDTNEAGAALLALQTRQQIAATALSMNLNSNAGALRLFGLSG